MKKEPVSNKKMSSLDDIAADVSGFGERSDFDVDPAIKELMSKKGLALRWLSAKKFKEDHGFNKSGWVPLRQDHLENEDVDMSDNPFGMFNAEGFIVRGTMLLAIRSMKVHKKHQERNRDAAKRAKEKVVSDAEKLAEKAKKEGGKLSVSIKDEM